MNSAETDDLDRLSVDLLQQASLLSKLVFRYAGTGISRSEAGLLTALEQGPQRITALAELEGLAQPTVTTLVRELERRGWVSRDRDPDDGRVVLVSLAPGGQDELDRFRAAYRPILRASLEKAPPGQVEALADATRAIAGLVSSLQEEASR